MFIVSSDKYKVGKGGSVTVQGAGFNESCKIRVAGLVYDLLDYSEDSIMFAAPDKIGTYQFVVFDDESVSGNMTLYVEEFENLPANHLPNRDESSFMRSLESMMSHGFAWNFGNGSYWHKFLSAIALVFAYIYGMLKNLVLQMSPFTTDSFGTWENELSLPRRGLEQSTTAGRKSEIVRISRKKGGATIPYLKSILNLYGVNYSLYEYWKNPEVFPHWVSSQGDDANFYVMVKIYAKNFYKYGMNCTSKCNASLGKQRDRILESIIDEIKQAHIKVIYSYVLRVLTDMDGNPLVTDDNKVITV